MHFLIISSEAPPAGNNAIGQGPEGFALKLKGLDNLPEILFSDSQ